MTKNAKETVAFVGALIVIGSMATFAYTAYMVTSEKEVTKENKKRMQTSVLLSIVGFSMFIIAKEKIK
jgi:hypothetical protein